MDALDADAARLLKKRQRREAAAAAAAADEAEQPADEAQDVPADDGEKKRKRKEEKKRLREAAAAGGAGGPAPAPAPGKKQKDKHAADEAVATRAKVGDHEAAGKGAPIKKRFYTECDALAALTMAVRPTCSSRFLCPPPAATSAAALRALL
jgi:hypothetical protein